MSENQRIAGALESMARLLELTGANRFRVNAFAKGARAVESCPQDLAKLSADPAKLQAIEGIGQSIAGLIVEFVEHGSIADLEALRAEVPAGVAQMLDIPGMGPKTARAIWQDLGVTTIEGLEQAIDDGSILTVPRMGEKSAEKLKRSIAFLRTSGSRLHLGIAGVASDTILAFLRGLDGVKRVEAAGSVRRGKETIGDLDFLVVASDSAAIHKAFCAMPGVIEVVGSGESKSSVRIDLGDFGSRWNAKGDEATGVQADLRTVPEASWGAALMYFTGSKEHNVRLRERAIKAGFTLNEYGLFPEDGEDGPPQSRGVEPIESATEEAIYARLGLAMIPPEIREDRGEFALEATPRLIETGDIRSELHAHTTSSDGVMSLDALIEQAIERGLHTIAVTDHSRSAVQANGLSVERLRAQRAEIELARERYGDRITILAGNEVDILTDGSLDYADDVLAELDHIVASPHIALSQAPAEATARLIRAIEHPLVRVLGHPTGRLINRRKGLEPAMDEIIAAAIEHDVALEINAHWMRLDLRDTHVRAAVEAGCLLAINTDAHAPEDFDNLRFGVQTGRRGWLGPEQCVNTWSKDKLRKWLKRG